MAETDTHTLLAVQEDPTDKSHLAVEEDLAWSVGDPARLQSDTAQLHPDPTRLHSDPVRLHSDTSRLVISNPSRLQSDPARLEGVIAQSVGSSNITTVDPPVLVELIVFSIHFLLLYTVCLLLLFYLTVIISHFL